MTELGTLLELLHQAPESYERLHAEFRTWCHEERVGGDDEESLVVQVGRTQWSYGEGWGAIESELDEAARGAVCEELEGLLDPSPYMSMLSFELRGRGSRAGRDVLLARAVPRGGGRTLDLDELDGLGEGADEYLLEVDAERGTVLRVEARRHGLPFSIVEAIRIAYDEPIAPERFVFDPPEGEEVRKWDELHPKVSFNIPLHEAARAAPFPVLIPATVPGGWRLTVTFMEAVARPPTPARMILDYRSADASTGLMISERPADAPRELAPTDGAPPITEVRREGVTMRIRESSPEWPQAHVEVVRDATAVELLSSELDAEALVRLALQLVPAPLEPPGI